MEIDEAMRKRKIDDDDEEEERKLAKGRRTWAETRWHPNQVESELETIDLHRLWRTDEIITPVTPMCYTDNSPRYSIYRRDTLQIYSIKVASIRGDLRWPLQVFGMVTVRDLLDSLARKRNIVFSRARSNCQIMTGEHPYLETMGPVRAIVTCSYDLGTIEVVLKAKGATEREDRDLCFLVLPLRTRRYCPYYRSEYTSKHNTLELTLRHVERSVEATISVQLVDGSSLPDCIQGVFTASIASVDDAEVCLLAFGDDKLPVVARDGMLELSRRVVSVELYDGELKVSTVARYGKNEQVARRDDIVFKPKKKGRSCGVLNVVGCNMQVNIAWSLFDN